MLYFKKPEMFHRGEIEALIHHTLFRIHGSNSIVVLGISKKIGPEFDNNSTTSTRLRVVKN